MMKQFCAGLACAMTLCGISLDAQTAAPSVSSGIQQSYNRIKSNFLAAADKMPEGDYGFQPVMTPDHNHATITLNLKLTQTSATPSVDSKSESAGH